LSESGRIQSWAALPLELISGVIFLGHGMQKLADPARFGSVVLVPLHVPAFMSYLVTAGEFGGALLLLTGVLVRLGALGQSLVMIGAISMVHWPNGLLAQNGFQFPLMLLGVAIALLILGPDPVSIDRNVGLFSWTHEQRGFGRTKSAVIFGNIWVRATGAVLIGFGIMFPLFRLSLGIPSGPIALAFCVLIGLISVASGAGIASDRTWAYGPAFAISRLYLGGSVLLLFFFQYAVRGVIAFVVSFAILIAIGSAKFEDER